MDPQFCELDEANRKVREWKREAKQSAPVHLSSGVDLSLSPADQQEVLPQLSPFEVLRTGDILRRLVQVPSITTTAAVSAVFGAFIGVLLTHHNYDHAALSRFAGLRRGIRRLIRLLLGFVASVAYLRFLARRYPTVQRVSQYQNLSHTSEGPCFVANHVLTLTNSQAGTHADGPHHFCRSLSHRNFDDAHYSGDAVVLDVSRELLFRLPDTEPHAITVDVIARACAKLPSSLRDGSCPLWRLLLVTRHAEEQLCSKNPSFVAQSLSVLLDSDNVQQPTQTVPPSRPPVPPVNTHSKTSYAFLYPETAEYLHRVFPRLLLVGIDSPSVDPTDVMPLVSHSHGALLRCGIAILENLRFNHLYPLLETEVNGKKGVVVGSMLTVFSSTQNYDDARGCSVVFFPDEENQ